MRSIALVSKDKKHFKIFKINNITRIDVTKLNADPIDEARGICIFEDESCTHTYELISLNFDHFVSFINGSELNDDIFIINVEKMEF